MSRSSYHAARFRCCILVSLLYCLALPVQAETVDWDGYKIYFTTFNSMLIPQAVADAHHIIRSKRRIVTNITIRRDGKPVSAKVTGHNTNLLNQLFQMDFTKVTEKEAIYYLANQIIDERDNLAFSITIQPESQSDSYQLKFRRQY